MTRYLTYDVFTDTPFAGNPLAVIPDATALSEDALQKIAAEFNYSETTFVFPPDDPTHTARVRIFKTTQELPFAGHPVIGTAVALAGMGHGSDMVLELGIGPVSVRADAKSASFTTNTPLDILGHPTPALIARILNLPQDMLETSPHPPTIASLGRPVVLTRLRDRAALSRIEVNTNAMAEGRAALPNAMDFAQYTWCMEDDRTYARMFAPLSGNPEDAATGSAAATLAALLAHSTGDPQNFTLTQGVEMGRPSRITLATDPSGVTVSGNACRIRTGQLLL
ncbi:PhzF family phenazine biosynthesis protein [Alisedimentitalea sp. MJ-SS2]|uniref:PhzF family phenazine biosynthesis protein n=1 Tax=Aliisedimentitalea sp. MJ-SS2 TaxID=3049795 RepID=UPI0029128440|nr:PhzF family phenazine biosynthesis protein [Alisedimentitalea sp. MJ-SS2]MDU8926536.1 PhzF family phenazine biosynthesis protein [Alisedimentitalea sp. MJ-SS2]